jgi:Methane/Phenol/Toluene Hydroxylase/MmoB/DmpM family
MYGQRDGMTQMINNSILVNASYKLRFAQDLTLYLAEVGLDAEKFDFEAGKQHWLNDVIWQGARKAIESVLGAEDYLEQYFAGNLLFEPLVLELVRSGLIMQFAAAHGDFVTPTIVAVAEGDFERNLANTVELFQILLHDPKEAEHNRGIVQGWLQKHLTLCKEAANQLQPIWSQPRVKVTSFGEAYAAAKNRIETILSQIGADLPKRSTTVSNLPTQPSHAAQDLELDDTISDACGVTMNDSVEGRIVAQVMEKKPGIVITHYPAMIRIDGRGKIEFDMAEIGDALGRAMDPYTFQVEMSTHHGRMVLFEDRIVLFGKLEDALEYE